MSSSNSDQPKLAHNVYIHEPAASQSTISTTATEPNLPGAGRTVGLVYDRLGGALEARLNRLAGHLRAVRSRRNTPPEVTTIDQSILPSLAPDFEYNVSVSSLSSTATAPNLPGAGRTVGLAYDFLGRLLVSRMNRLATMLGFGPEEAGKRIFERTRRVMDELKGAGDYTQHLTRVFHPSDNAKFENDCRRLLKYAKSSVLTTQEYALREVIDLSVRDPYIREVFNRLDVVNVLGSVISRLERTRDPSLDLILNNSRKALISTTEVSVNCLSQKLEVFFWSGETNYDHVNELLQLMLTYLSDSIVSFLVLRQLEILLDDCLFAHYDLSGGNFNIAAISAALSNLVPNSSETVDWESLDMILSMWFRIWENRLEIQKETADILRIVYRYPGNLPQTVSSIVASAELFGTTNYIPPPLALWAVIEESVGDMDLCAVPYACLLSAVAPFQNHLLSEMWANLICPANLVWRQIIVERRPMWSSVSGRAKRIDIERVPVIRRFVNLYKQLVELCKSLNESIGSRAALHVYTARKLDRYCWNAVSHIDHSESSEIDAAGQLTSSDAIDTLKFGYPGLRLYRHTCSDGRLHLVTQDDWRAFQCACARTIDWRVLQLGPNETLWLEVSRNSIFSSADHYPVLARMPSNAEEPKEYTAGVFLNDRSNWDSVRFCTVRDGARFDEDLYPEDLVERARYGQKTVTSLRWREVSVSI